MAVNEKNSDEKKGLKLPYTPPAIVYEGIITARAGSLSPVGVPEEDFSGVNPVDLFGNSGSDS